MGLASTYLAGADVDDVLDAMQVRVGGSQLRDVRCHPGDLVRFLGRHPREGRAVERDGRKGERVARELETANVVEQCPEVVRDVQSGSLVVVVVVVIGGVVLDEVDPAGSG